MSDQASHPYKTTDNIIVVYILIFMDLKLEDEILHRTVASITFL